MAGIMRNTHLFFLIYILYVLKASDCSINEQEERKKEEKDGDSVVQSNEGGMLLYQAEHLIKRKGTVAALPTPEPDSVHRLYLCTQLVPEMR